MKMTAKKKIAIAFSCILAVTAIVAASVMGTVAYLTSSAVVHNTFTIGQVGISMTEALVDANGQAVTGAEAKRVTDNKYTLVPGKTYSKDPIIEVTEGSQDSYLFVHIKNDLKTIAANDTEHPSIATQMAKNGWARYLKGSTGWIYVYCGDDVTEDDANNETGWVDGKYTPETVNTGSYQLFENFTITGSISETELAPYSTAEIKITAIAIQDDGFDNDIAKAWQAVHATYPYILVPENSSETP